MQQRGGAEADNSRTKLKVFKYTFYFKNVKGVLAREMR